MDNVKIIKIETNGAITSVQDLKNHIKELQDILVNTEKDTKEYEDTVNELVASQTKLNEVMAATKKNASAAEGSYNALVNQMSALKTAWRATTSEVQRAQLGEKIKAINEQLKDYDASIGNNQRKVGSYEEALQVLNKTFDSQRQELAALKNALDNLEPGTDAYNEAFQRATDITHNLRERQEQLRMSANDLGTQLSNVMSVGAGLVSGFNAINAIMTLTGQKNEDLQKTMVKLQAGIALVQSAKGIEGAVKSFKAYTKWAANAYDSIVKWIGGSKDQQKQIEATTKATEANATANNLNATAEKNATVGATQLSVGMKGTAAATTTATAAMTAFKAVLMSLGIGIVVAAVAGLVGLLQKLANSSKEAYDKMKQDAQTRYDMEQDLIENINTQLERKWEVEKAQGAEELDILQKRYEEYHKQLDVWADIRAEAQEFLRTNEIMKGRTRDWAVPLATMPETLNVAGKSILDMQTALENMADNGNKYLKKFEVDAGRSGKKVVKEAQEAFDRIKEKGIQSFDDIYWVVYNYNQALIAQADAYKLDPLGGLENDVKVEAESILKEAKDFNKSEIQLENDAYAQRKAALEKAGYDTEALTKAHNKKVYQIITAATQSILDAAKAANQTELQNLEDKYKKELKILKQYGRDTTELTKAYEKQRQQIIFNNDVKALENKIKFTEETIAEYKRTYDELNAMGVDRAADAERIQREEHEITSKVLKEQFDEWRKLWEQYGEDQKLTEEQRLQVKEKYLNAKKALEKEDTDYLLQQIKTRKQALDEEIDLIERNYNNTSRMQSLNTEHKYVKNSGLGDTFWGASQNASYGQMKDDLNAAFNIDKARLQEEIAAYQEYAATIAQTDAERTYAAQMEAEKRMELATLERENLIDNLKLEIDENHELINTIVDVGNSIGDILGSVADAWESSIQAQLNAGKISQEEADKQLERVRDLQVVQAIINTLSGSIGAFAQASATIPPPYGQIVGAAAAAAVVAAGVAQIAQIKAASKGSSIGGSTMMAQVTPTMTDYEPTMVGSATGEEETERLANAIASTPIWVSVQDIDSAQERGRVKVTENTY